VNLLEIVSTNIRYYRKTANLTQEALGAKSKLSSDYLSRLERGEENISILSLERVAKALKISPDLLLKENSK
jgi:transcriptional regulator with XRE-family HTH domain